MDVVEGSASFDKVLEVTFCFAGVKVQIEMVGVLAEDDVGVLVGSGRSPV